MTDFPASKLYILPDSPMHYRIKIMARPVHNIPGQFPISRQPPGDDQITNPFTITNNGINCIKAFMIAVDAGLN